MFRCLVLRWSAIATHLPKRTDNEIKNYWNTHLKKRLAKMGIDPVTHKPKNDALLSIDGQSKSAANLSHMAQWESARLEAEARLVRESKLRSHSLQQQQICSSGFPSPSSVSTSAPVLNKPEVPPISSRTLDVLKAWNGGWVKSTEGGESPSSSLTFSENAPPIMTSGLGESTIPMIEFVGTSGSSETGIVKEEGEQEWKGYESSVHLPEYKDGIDNSMSFVSSLHELTMSMEGTWTSESLRNSSDAIAEEGFTNLLLNTNSDDRSLSEDGGGESNNNDGSGGSGSDFYEDNKNYWNSILNLVNSSPSDSPMF